MNSGSSTRRGGFLLGRRTYESFAGHWPNAPEEVQVLARPFNTLPKYVASTTLTDPLAWQNSTLNVHLATPDGTVEVKVYAETGAVRIDDRAQNSDTFDNHNHGAHNNPPPRPIRVPLLDGGDGKVPLHACMTAI
jgi:hypothetical protein